MASLPGNILEIRYRRTGKHAGRYAHTFGPNVALRLGPGRNRAQLYHRKGQPIWARESDADYDRWVALDHRRRTMNPKRKKRSYRRGRRYSGGSSSNLLLYAGLALILYPMMTRSAYAVSTGGQAIIPQDAGTYWIADPFNGGDGTFFQGSLPPGSAPPWRLASTAEVTSFVTGLASGAYTNAGGGLYPVAQGLIF